MRLAVRGASMNEQRSKLVDELAMEKIIKEKLVKVSHSPYNSLFNHDDISFSDLLNCRLNLAEVKLTSDNNGLKHFCFESYFKSLYKENNTVYLYYHPAEERAEGNILFVHGLFDDNLNNCSFIKILNKLNFNVFFMIMPYHYNRKPESSLFSGEFFLSADIHRSIVAFKQAVFDVEYSLQIIKDINALPTLVSGFSMGGSVVFRHSLLKKQPMKTFLISPISNLPSLIWDSPLLSTIGQTVTESGFDMDYYNRICKEIDSCDNLGQEFKNQMVAAVYPIYDQLISVDNYKTFIDKTGITYVIPYSTGHVNILTIPRLAVDIYNYYNA